jgi:flagellar L-ring protein precursor FlgH
MSHRHDLPNHGRIRRRMRALAGAALLAALATGCNSLERLSQVGEAPTVSPVTNPTHAPTYQPVTMPMPRPVMASALPNSLWRPGSRAFFKDLRASEIGDILTVAINIDERADINNSTTRTRATNEDVDTPALLGFEAAADAILPEAVNPAALLAFSGTTNNVGTGVIDRDEEIVLNVAAIVTQVLPNGNLVIHGTQETRVNFEVRQLQITGVIRPQDISATNTINYEQIAEARLAYGGEGQISDFQQPRWGTQIMDVIMPF